MISWVFLAKMFCYTTVLINIFEDSFEEILVDPALLAPITIDIRLARKATAAYVCIQVFTEKTIPPKYRPCDRQLVLGQSLQERSELATYLSPVSVVKRSFPHNMIAFLAKKKGYFWRSLEHDAQDVCMSLETISSRKDV